MNKTQIISQLRNRQSSKISNLADSTVSRRFTKEELGDFLLSSLDWDEAVALNLVDVETLQRGEQNSLQALTVDGAEVVFEAELPPAELPGLRVVESYDKEQERFLGYDCSPNGEPVPVWGDTAEAGRDPWFCQGGQEWMTEGFKEENFWGEAPEKNFYSQAKPISWRKQRENFVGIMTWIFQNRENKELLQRGWKRFWQRVFSHKAKNDTFQWMWQRQIKAIRAAFEAQGVKAKEK